MQKKIQTYESSSDTPALDPDLPPELAAAVAQGRQASRYPLLSLASASLPAAICLLKKLADQTYNKRNVRNINIMYRSWGM